jgi:YVTN family beta-propeller protein
VKRPRLRIAAAALAGFAVLALGARFAAVAHVRSFTRDGGPADLSCGRCHGDWGLFWRGPQREGYPDPAGMALSPDGRTLYVACEGTDALAILDLGSARVRAQVAFPPGSLPHGVAAAPDGRSVFVSLRGRDRVARVDAGALSFVESGPVGRGPCGLALDPSGGTLVVADAESNDAALVDAKSLSVLALLAAGREPYRVAVSPDGRFAHVVNRMSGLHGTRDLPVSEVTVIDIAARRVVARVPLPSCHLSEGIAFLPDGSRSVIPAVRVRNRLPISQVAKGWVMSGAIALVPADGSGPAEVLPTDDADRFWADPAGVAVAGDGSAAFVAAAGADAVSVISLPHLLAAAAAPPPADGGEKVDRTDLAADFVDARLPVGADPREVAASRDGSRFFVAERWDGMVAVVDARSRKVVSRVDLGGPRGEPSAVRRGDRVFHSASVTFQGGFSCSSCHPGGHQDGLVYDFETDGPGRNPVDNRSLLGIRGTNPFKWTGLNPGLSDQCGPRFAKVLTRADPFPARELADLVAYIESRPPRRGNGARTEAVERGKEVFFRTRLADGRELPEQDRCQTCHPPPLYTNRKSVAVGTKGELDTESAFDVPHLVGVEGSAPYLHDGRAPTLEAIWTLHNPDDRHGVTSDMNKQQLNDLVEFLKTL